MKKFISFFIVLALIPGLLFSCRNKANKNQTEGTSGETGAFIDNIFDETTAGNTATETSSPSSEGQNQSGTQPAQESTATQPSDGSNTQPTEGQSASQPTGEQASSQPTEAESSEPTEAQATDPTSPSGSGSSQENALVKEYEKYLNMTAEEKEAFRQQFTSYDAFFDWYNAAYKAYKEANPPTPIGEDGQIVLN